MRAIALTEEQYEFLLTILTGDDSAKAQAIRHAASQTPPARKVYVTLMNDPLDRIFGPFWCITDISGYVFTDPIEHILEQFAPGFGLPTFWFDVYSQIEKIRESKA